MPCYTKDSMSEDHKAPPGPAVAKQVATMFRTALPDLHVAVEDLIAEGDVEYEAAL